MRWVIGSLVATGSVEGDAFVVVLATAEGRELHRFVLTDIGRVDAVVDALYEMSTAFAATPAAPAEAASAPAPEALPDDFGGAPAEPPADDFGGAVDAAPAAPDVAPADDFGGAPADDFGGAPADDFGGAPAEVSAADAQAATAAGVASAAPVELWRIETERDLDIVALATRLRALRGGADGARASVLWKVSAQGDYRDACNGRYALSHAVRDPAGAALPAGFRDGAAPGEVDAARYALAGGVGVVKSGIVVTLRASVDDLPASATRSDDEGTRRALTGPRAVLRVARGEWGGTVKSGGLTDRGDDLYVLSIDASLSSPTLGMVKQAEAIRDRLVAAGVTIEAFEVTVTDEELAEIQRYAGEGHVYTGAVALLTPPGLDDSGDALAWRVTVLASKARANLAAFEATARKELKGAVRSVNTMRRHGTQFVKVNAQGYGDKGYRAALKALPAIGRGFGGFLAAYRTRDLPAGLYAPDRERTTGVYSEEDLRLLRPETVPRVVADAAGTVAPDAPVAADDFGGAPPAPAADDFGGAPPVDDFGGAAVAPAVEAASAPVSAAYSSGDAPSDAPEAPAVNAVTLVPPSQFARGEGVRIVWTVPDGGDVYVDSARTEDVSAALRAAADVARRLPAALARLRVSDSAAETPVQGDRMAVDAYSTDCQLSLFGGACENRLTVRLATAVGGEVMSLSGALQQAKAPFARYGAASFALYADALRLALAGAGFKFNPDADEYRYAAEDYSQDAERAAEYLLAADPSHEKFAEVTGHGDYRPVAAVPHALLRSLGCTPHLAGVLTAVDLAERWKGPKTDRTLPRASDVAADAPGDATVRLGDLFVVSFDNAVLPPNRRGGSEENAGAWTLARVVGVLTDRAAGECFVLDVADLPDATPDGSTGPLVAGDFELMAAYYAKDGSGDEVFEFAGDNRILASASAVRLCPVGALDGFAPSVAGRVAGRLEPEVARGERSRRFASWSFDDDYVPVEGTPLAGKSPTRLMDGDREVLYAPEAFARRYAKELAANLNDESEFAGNGVPSWRLVGRRVAFAILEDGEKGLALLGEATEKAVDAIDALAPAPFALRLDGAGVVASLGAASAPPAAEAASAAAPSTADPEQERLARLAARFGRELEALRREFE